MKSIDFPGAYLKIGEGQDEYHIVHAMPIDGPEGEVIAIYELSDEELQQIAKTKRILYSRWTFQNKTMCKHCKQVTPVGFQPFRMSAFPIPFKAELVFEGGKKEDVEAFVFHDGVRITGYKKTKEGKYVKLEEGEVEPQPEPKEWFVECPACGCGTNKNDYNFCMNCGQSMKQGERYK